MQIQRITRPAVLRLTNHDKKKSNAFGRSVSNGLNALFFFSEIFKKLKHR